MTGNASVFLHLIWLEASVLLYLKESGDDGQNLIIIYQYHPTRNGDAAAEFFKGSDSGTYIIVDGYAGYNKLKDFKRCCCYAHIRRYFLEAIPKGKEKDYTDLPYRDSSIAINYLNTRGDTVKKVSPVSKYITAVSGIRSPL